MKAIIEERRNSYKAAIDRLRVLKWQRETEIEAINAQLTQAQFRLAELDELAGLPDQADPSGPGTGAISPDGRVASDPADGSPEV